LGEIDIVGLGTLHALLRDGPDGILEIDLIPDRVQEFAFAYQSQQDQTQPETNRRQRGNVFELLEHNPDFDRRERAVLRYEGGDRGWADIVRRVKYLLAVKNGERVNLLNDVADMDGGSGRTAILHFGAELAQIVGLNLSEKAILPDREDVAVKDRLAHRAGALRHPRFLEPELSNCIEGPRHS
jgi:hypothetical protein